MKNLNKIKICLLLIINLITILGFGQKNENEQYEQVLINKIQLSDLQNKNSENNEQIKKLNTEINNLNKLISDLKKEVEQSNTKYNQFTEDNTYKNTLITWGLTILAILVTFFGVVVPIAGLFFGRRMKREVEIQSNEAREIIKQLKLESEKEISKFISNSKERINIYMDNIRQYEIEGKEKSQLLGSLLDKAKSVDILSDEKRNKNIKKAQQVKEESGVSEFEIDMANAFELFYKKDFGTALSKFRSIIRRHHSITTDKLSSIFFQMAYCYSQLGSHKKSIQYYKASLEIDPEDYLTLNNLAVAYQDLAYTTEGNFKNKSFQDALKYIKKAIEYNPSYSMAQYNLGNIYDDMENYEESIKAYKKAIELDKFYIRPYLNLIEYYIINNEFDLACEYLEKTNKIPDSHSPILKILEIIVLKQTNKWEKSLQESFEEIKERVLLNQEEFKDWSFDYLINYIEKIDNDNRDFLLEMCRQLKEYRTK